MQKGGLYIHFPFCKSKCDYCNFYSVSKSFNKDLIEKYINCLILEIIKYNKVAKSFPFDSIYFGGGTPSLIPINYLQRILSVLTENYNLTENIDITLECNPRDVNYEVISNYKKIGINRITLGVQTLDENAYKIIGRQGGLCSFDKLNKISQVKDVALCVDMIIGIPGQTRQNCIDDLKKIIKAKPKHISVYLLTVEKNTKLYKRIKLDNSFDSLQVEQFKAVIELLVNAGYEHYEVSNFALPGFKSKHNLKYWNFEPYIGFGPSAHSFFYNKRWHNEANVDNYILNKNIIEEDERNENSQIVEFIMTGLRLREGFSINQFKTIFDRDFPENILIKLNEQGEYVEKYEKDDTIFYRITDKGFFLTDEIIFKVVEDLI